MTDPQAEIDTLRARVAELESELADTLEDAVRQGAYRDGDIYSGNGSATWEAMMNRLVELGRFEIVCSSGPYVSGRFLPREESNELPPTSTT